MQKLTFNQIPSIPLVKNSKNPKAGVSFKKCNRLKSAALLEANNGENRGKLTGSETGITVIDLDFYSKGNKTYEEGSCRFIKAFGKDFVKVFNTFTVRTPNKGYHLYFRYDKDVKQTANESFKIDVRSDGGYVVAPGSTIDGKEYKIINNKTIKTIPADLKKFILSMSKDKNDSKTKCISKKVVTNTKGDYRFHIRFAEFFDIIHHLPSKYWENRDDWIVFTTASKILGFKVAWDEINKMKPNYDASNNLKLWNSVDTKLTGTVDSILTAADKSLYVNYYKYKPVLENTIKPTQVINKKKLGYEFFNSQSNFVVKSDTGTGKTTSLVKYMDRVNYPFISIVSRISLGTSQYETMASKRDVMKFYQTQKDFKTGDSLIIQIDSIQHLLKIDDFSNYVVFLDEFNSIIEHLVTSPTLSKNRVLAYALMLKLLKGCKQFIATDADISDISLDFLKDVKNKTYDYIVNKHMHNNATPTEEIFEYELLMQQLKNTDKYLCCCDSATEATRMHDSLKVFDENIKLVTADTQKENNYESVNLDKWDKVIFSPSIVYGLDSTVARPVFAVYKELTITPSAMLQQINRNRNIKKLYYYFTKKSFNPSTKTLTEFRSDLKDSDAYGQLYFNMMDDGVLKEPYINLLSRFEYNYSCYNTNKYAHFNKMLDDRGFKRKFSVGVTQFDSQTKEDKQQRLVERIAAFDPENKYVKRINEMLRIPEDKMLDHVELFVDKFKLERHFDLCTMLYKNNDDIQAILEESKDFNLNKFRSKKNKICFLNEFRDKLKLADQSLALKEVMSENDQREYLSKYKLLFRCRDNKASLQNLNETNKILTKMYKQLFGADIIVKDDRKMIDGIRVQYYKLNHGVLSEHIKVYGFRKPKDIPRLV